MVKLTYAQLQALSDVFKGGAYEVLLEQVESVRLSTGETLSGGNGLLVATVYFDDQRDGRYESKYLLGSALTGGKALHLA